MAKVGVANNSIDKLDPVASVIGSDLVVVSDGTPETSEKSATMDVLKSFLISTVEHNDLPGIQGGVLDERNHLSDAELTEIGSNSGHRNSLSGNPHNVTIVEIGAIGGSITDNQIAFGSSTANQIEGSSSLTWDGITLQVATSHIQTNSILSIGSHIPINKAEHTTSVGERAGAEDQEDSAWAGGRECGHRRQGRFATATGPQSGKEDQSESASSYGSSSGRFFQGAGALALATEAGRTNQGENSIAGGKRAGFLDQGPGGIIFSSTGVEENETSAGHITLISSLASMKYNSTTDAFTFSKGIVLEGALDVAGGMRLELTNITAATYNILVDDTMIFADTTIQPITLTLPAIVAGAADDGRFYRVQKFIDSTNALTVTPQAPNTIHGETTNTIMGIRNDNASFMANGGNWYIINRDTAAVGSIELATPGATQSLTGTQTILSVWDTNRFTTPGIAIADQANNVVTVDNVEALNLGGDAYILGFRIEINSFTNNQEIQCEIFVDGVATNISDVRQVSNALNTVIEAAGLFQISGSPQNVEVRIDASTTALATFEHAQMVIERVGK